MTDSSFNPYEPPRADADVAPPSDTIASPLFAVSTTKLVLLSILTFDLYILYWMYQQWKALRDHGGHQVSPFWRAVFGVLFCVPLFASIRSYSIQTDLHPRSSTGLLAAMFIGFTIAGRIGDRLDITLLSWVSLLSVIPIVIMQQEVNTYVRKVEPDADMNERFSAANIVVMVLGGLVWILVLVGTLLPD